MPIYEYRCRQCGVKFEALVRGREAVVCRSCFSADLERLVSLFAVDSEGTRGAAREASMPRSRKAQMDKEVADLETYERHRH